MTDFVIRNARVMTCDPARQGLGIIDRGAIAIADGAIVWIGDDAQAPSASATIDANRRLVTPGLVDCHTHAIFAGDRATEFAMRAAGRPYLEIAAAGGGIQATLEPTRAATDAQLVELTRGRLASARRHGTTTIEIKTGYDLTTEGELRLLRCLAAAQDDRGPRIVPTLLAHLVPAERARDRDGFIQSVCNDLIPRARGLATSVDIYCDEGAYTLAEARTILTTAASHGFAVRGHVGQFKDLGAAELLGELGARSADHVEQITDAGIAALARAGVVAVMLPGACVQLRLPVPPVDKLRRAGVALALATDLNPGSSYSEALPLQLWLATTHYGMTVEEAWLGVTRHGAKALGVDAGQLVVGARADLALWKCGDPAEVPYHYGEHHVDRVWVGGSTPKT